MNQLAYRFVGGAFPGGCEGPGKRIGRLTIFKRITVVADHPCVILVLNEVKHEKGRTSKPGRREWLGGVGGVVHVSRTKYLRQQECGTLAAGGAAPYQRAESLKGTSANTFDEVQESVFSTLRNEALYASFVRMV